MGNIQNAYVGYQAGSQAGGMWGGAGGAIDGYFNGPIFKAHMKRLKDWYTFPQLDKLQLNDPTAGMDEWLKQVPYQDRLQSVLDMINGKNNAGYRAQLESADPYITQNAAQQGLNTQGMLRGDLPDDVKAQIARSSAYQSLMGGFGGSQMSRALTARDLGLSSLDLMGRGEAGLKDEAAMAHFLTPYNQQPLDLFTSAPDLLQRDDRVSAYNNQLANQQKALDFASHIATSGGDTSGIMNMVGGMYGRGGNNQQQPVGNDSNIGSIVNAIVKFYGGGGQGQQGNPSAYTTNTGTENETYWPATTTSWGG